MKSTLHCGAARVEITAKSEWYPLFSGFFGDDIKEDSYQVGSLDPQFARAIALQNDDTTILMVSLDHIAVPGGSEITKMISEATGVANENIFIFATHTHNVPALGFHCRLEDDPNFGHFQEIKPDVAARQLRYEQHVWEGIRQACLEAMAALRPAKIGIGYSESYVNVNRDQFYDGNGEFCMGFNGAGHSDKTLAVIRFADEQDQTIALFVNYAVHAIVLFLNRCIDGKPGSTADLPGAVCTAYERQHPGAVCMWSPAANGNQNPIYMTYYGYPDYATGKVYESVIPNGGYEYLNVLGGRHYADILRAEHAITDYADAIDMRICREAQQLPIDREVPSRFAESEEEKQGKRSLFLTGMMLGNIFLYGIGGELYSTLGAFIKERSPYRHTLICSQVYTTVGYLMDDENLLRPTLFARGSRWLPNTIAPALDNFMKRFTK